MLVQATSWDKATALRNLTILSNVNFHHIIESKTSYIAATTAIIESFSPAQDRFIYQKVLQNMRSIHFPSVTEFLRGMRDVVELTNFCLSEHKKLLNREVLGYYAKGLTREEKEIFLQLPELSLETLAKELDAISFRRKQILEMDMYQKESRPFYKHNNNKHNNYTVNRSKKKAYNNNGDVWYSLHKTSSHSDKDCNAQKKNNFHINNNSSKGDLTATILNNDSKIKITLDTGSEETYVAPECVTGIQEKMLIHRSQ